MRFSAAFPVVIFITSIPAFSAPILYSEKYNSRPISGTKEDARELGCTALNPDLVSPGSHEAFDEVLDGAQHTARAVEAWKERRADIAELSRRGIVNDGVNEVEDMIQNTNWSHVGHVAEKVALTVLPFVFLRDPSEVLD